MLDMDNTAYEARLKQLEAMPEGDAKRKAIEAHTRDYKGRGQLATDNLGTAQSDFSSAMDPLAMTKGPSGNPFARDVGPGIAAHIGRGMQMYDANKRRKGAESALEGLSAGKEGANKGMWDAGIQSAQARRLRKEKEDKERMGRWSGDSF